jgi:hypothetical protein
LTIFFNHCQEGLEFAFSHWMLNYKAL